MNMTLESLRGFLDDLIGEYDGDTPLIMNLNPIDENSNEYTDLFQFNAKAVMDDKENSYLAISLTALKLTVAEEETKKATQAADKSSNGGAKKRTTKRTTKKKEAP